MNTPIKWRIHTPSLYTELLRLFSIFLRTGCVPDFALSDAFAAVLGVGLCELENAV